METAWLEYSARENPAVLHRDLRATPQVKAFERRVRIDEYLVHEAVNARVRMTQSLIRKLSMPLAAVDNRHRRDVEAAMYRPLLGSGSSQVNRRRIAEAPGLTRGCLHHDPLDVIGL